MLPHKLIGVAIIINEQGQVLIARRLPSGLMAGLWEFPGGKVEADETPENCIKREIAEELALEVEVGEHLITVNHSYQSLQVTLIAHICPYQGGEPQPLASQEIRWVNSQELGNYNFPEANQQLITALHDWQNDKKVF